MSRLISRNVVVGRRRTSMRLEPEIWGALDEVCQRERMTLDALVSDRARAVPVGQRTSRVRTLAVAYFRAAATEEGHALAGHGTGDLAAT